MYEILLPAHSGLRWVSLLLIVAVVVLSASGMTNRSPFSPLQRKLSLFAMVSLHIQLLIGFALYMTSPLVHAAHADMGLAMKDGVLRYWAVEHMAAMIAGIALVTVGHILAKKAKDDASSNKWTLVYYGLALFAFLISIPWPFRNVGAGRGWF